MRNLWRITFTGLDERCDLDALIALSKREPRLEYGILFGGRSTHPRRYPRAGWINEAVPVLKKAGIPVALHVCGTEVDQLLQSGELPALSICSEVDRIQLNRRIDGALRAQFERTLARPTHQTFITQFDLNPTLHESSVGRPHQVLFDASGGRGVLRTTWPQPLNQVTCGFAGGLGPETLPSALRAIHTVVGSRVYWIDMESGVRSAEDYLCSRLVEEALTSIQAVERALVADRAPS